MIELVKLTGVIGLLLTAGSLILLLFDLLMKLYSVFGETGAGLALLLFGLSSTALSLVIYRRMEGR